MFADLHLHTNFSDGTYTPEELAAHGKRVGLAAMALTDHDTLEGCERMAVAIQFFAPTLRPLYLRQARRFVANSRIARAQIPNLRMDSNRTEIKIGRHVHAPHVFVP